MREQLIANAGVQYVPQIALQDPDKEKIAEMLKQNYKESSFTAQLPR